jgi:hypothetical protein
VAKPAKRKPGVFVSDLSSSVFAKPAISSGINRDEWLEALGDSAAPNDPDSLSIAEIGKLFNIDRQTAARRVAELLKGGKAVSTFKQITNSSGYVRRVPSYRLVTPAKKGAR